MTDNELVRAFRMRMDGKSYDEIGAAIGYSSATIGNGLRDVLKGRRAFRVVASKEYPRLGDYITSKHRGNVTEFAKKAGCSPGAIYDALNGSRRPTQETLSKIRAVAGNIV